MKPGYLDLNYQRTPGPYAQPLKPQQPSIYSDLPAQLLYVKDQIAPQVKSASNVQWYFSDANLSKTVDQHESDEEKLRVEADQTAKVNQGLDQFTEFWNKNSQLLPDDRNQYGYQSQPVDLGPYNQKMDEGRSMLDNFPHIPKEPAPDQPNVWALAAAAIGAALTPEHAWDIASAPFQFELGERDKKYRNLMQEYERTVQIAQAKFGLTKDQATAYLNTAVQNAQASNQQLSQQADQLFKGRLANADSWNRAFLDYFNNAETFRRLEYNSQMEMALTALRFGNDPSLPPEMRSNAAQFFKQVTGRDTQFFVGKTPQNVAQEISNSIQGTAAAVSAATSGSAVRTARLQPSLVGSEISRNNAATAGQVIDNQWKPRNYQSEIDLRDAQGRHLGADTAKTEAETGVIGAGGQTIQQLQGMLDKYRDDERQAKIAEKAPRIKMGEIERQIRDANKPGGWGPFTEKTPDYEKRIQQMIAGDSEYQANKQAADEFKAMAEQAKSSAAETEGRIKGYKPSSVDFEQRLYRSATEFYNKPTTYSYGADGQKNSFDCSSAICKIYKDAGITLPRTSGEQFKVSTPVTDGKVQVGDLVFFRGTDPKHKGSNDISHVGMIYGFDASGNPLMLHQSSGSNETKIVDLKSSKYHMAHLAGIGRVKH